MARTKTTRIGNGATGPGWGGPATGPGWGGTAKGASGRPACPFRGSVPGARKRDTAHRLAREVAHAERAESAQALMDELLRLAFDAPSDMLQIMAIEAWLIQHEGRPIARTVSATIDAMSDDDIRSELLLIGSRTHARDRGVPPIPRTIF